MGPIQVKAQPARPKKGGDGKFPLVTVPHTWRGQTCQPIIDAARRLLANIQHPSQRVRIHSRGLRTAMPGSCSDAQGPQDVGAQRTILYIWYLATVTPRDGRCHWGGCWDSCGLLPKEPVFTMASFPVPTLGFVPWSCWFLGPTALQHHGPWRLVLCFRCLWALGFGAQTKLQRGEEHWIFPLPRREQQSQRVCVCLFWI